MTSTAPSGAAAVRTAWAALILTGAVGGVLSGLFAVGGAIVMVPLLVWRAAMDQRRAAATSLVAIIPTAVVSSATYLVHVDVDIAAVALISVGAIGGAILGSRLLRRLPLTWLRWMFIAFLLLVAAHLLVAAPEPTHALAFSPLAAAGYLGLGVLTGIASGLFGIGGAIISVPVLGSVFALSDAVAKGTALLVSIPTSLAGTMSNRHGSSSVDIRAGLILGVTAAATSVPAVYVAVALPPAVSAVSFAVLLIAIAIQLSIKAAQAHTHKSAPSDPSLSLRNQ
ncbi:sulfite exporter TauE/SafE family protein [Mycobacterium sp. CPCC 205372]|uniref:Probable membrane transporter protein n=1 Tax=Mycobacterium hippophais TaxID=3016340 RepID=A0ABT4PX35_9MYCO|nr:sulfite exporter TauE/SafE family protein [Mycobacterium hippophais]MCZ8381143.1 sulfite exporter TauE/SafE family protein [Mycobacterium hippophais]